MAITTSQLTGESQGWLSKVKDEGRWLDIRSVLSILDSGKLYFYKLIYDAFVFALSRYGHRENVPLPSFCGDLIPVFLQWSERLLPSTHWLLIRQWARVSGKHFWVDWFLEFNICLGHSRRAGSSDIHCSHSQAHHILGDFKRNYLKTIKKLF